jgi:hypothetical protein
MSNTISVGSLKEQVKHYAVGQALFVVLATRSKKHRNALAADIAKDPMLRLAKRYRTGGEPARFPSANVVLARHTWEAAWAVLEERTTIGLVNTL